MRTGLISLACAAAFSFAACAVDTGTTFYTPNSTATVQTLPAVAQTPSAQPALARQTIVLVHGAWAGGWEWKPVGDQLRDRGHLVYRPTLTGQGEREHLTSPEISLDTHIQDVVNAILFDNLRDIVLVGHSYGGMVVTGVADRIPDRIKCLIYIDAHVPLDGESSNTVRKGGPRVAVDGFIQLNPPPRGNRRPPYIVKMPEKTFNQPISLKNQPAALKIPTAYILTVENNRQPADDDFFKSYTRAQERGWAVSVMPGDHVVHINQTANVVQRLEQATRDAKPAQ